MKSVRFWEARPPVSSQIAKRWPAQHSDQPSEDLADDLLQVDAPLLSLRIEMPKGENVISDEERRKRLRKTAREIETSEDPKDFERAFRKIAGTKSSPQLQQGS